MAKPPRGSDLVTLLRGLSRVGSAVVDVRSQEVTKAWVTSSLRPLIIQGSSNLQETITKVLQEPQSLKRDVSKGAAEALARISMVTEGIKAYRNGSTPTAGFSQENDQGYDPMYDPNVQELSIEEIMMQEAVTGHSDQTVAGLSLSNDRQLVNALSSIQEVADTIGESANETKETIKRMDQYEPFLDVTEFEEREITEEHLQVLDNKLYDLQDVALGHDLSTFNEAKDSKPVEEATEDGIREQLTIKEGTTRVGNYSYKNDISDNAEKVSDSLSDPYVQELSIEEVLMQDTLSGHSNQALAEFCSDSDKQATDVLSGVHIVGETIEENLKEAKEIGEKKEEFDSFLNLAKFEEREMTEEHLQVLDEKLSEIRNIAFGHDLKIFKEVEQSKPLEQVIEDVIKEQTAVKEGTTHTVDYGHKTETQVMQSTGISENVEEVHDDSHTQELSVEGVIMQEALGVQNNQMEVEIPLSDRQFPDPLFGAHEVADAFAQIKNVKEEISEQMEQYEPPLDITKIEEKEITEEHLQVLDEKLSELQDVAFGHNLKIFKEVEHSIPSEEIMQDEGKQVITENIAEVDNYSQETGKDVVQENFELNTNEERALKDHALQSVSHSQSVSENKNADDVDTRLSQMAKSVNFQTSHTSSVPHIESAQSNNTIYTSDSVSAAVSSNTDPDICNSATNVDFHVDSDAKVDLPQGEGIASTSNILALNELNSVSNDIVPEMPAITATVSAEVVNPIVGSSQTVANTEVQVDPKAELPEVESESISMFSQDVSSSPSHTKLNPGIAAAVDVPVDSEVDNVADTVSSSISNTVADVSNAATSATVSNGEVQTVPELELSQTESVTSTKSTLLIEERLPPNPASVISNSAAATDIEVCVDPKVETSQTESAASTVSPDVSSASSTSNTSDAIANAEVQIEPKLEPPYTNSVSSTASTLSQDVSVPHLNSVDFSSTTVDASTAVDAQVVPELDPSKMESLASPTSIPSKEDVLPPTPASLASNNAAATNVDVHIDPKVGPSQTENVKSTTGTLSLDESSSTSIITAADVKIQTEHKLEPLNTDSGSSTTSTLPQDASATSLNPVGLGTAAVDADIIGNVDANPVAFTAATAATATVAANIMHDVDEKIQVKTVENQNKEAAVAASNVSSVSDESMTTTTATVAATRPLASSDKTSIVQEKMDKGPIKPKPKLLGKKPLAKGKLKSTLSDSAQARKVPHSRIGRLMSFGGLAAGLGAGALAEVTRRSLGVKQGKDAGSLLDGSPFLTEANAKRIVDTLCRVRGAALKLGQMLSIQDSAFINPQLQKIFERVRQSADFMPAWQLEKAVTEQLGEDWRSKVASFDERPFAAASIGQVHIATLHDSRSVAMKIQYPGVAQGIESDINNLISTLKVADIIPEGLFVDSVIEVAKKELSWECDYIREAECTRRFSELVKSYPEYYVPEVISELCTEQVFTTELIDGVPVDKCVEMDQDTRNFISEKIIRLCLLELFSFGFMQTDPNWSNFFYNAETEQLALLDFGACRQYSKDFVDKYIHLIHGAAVKDDDKILKYSQELGFLTGHEAKVMEKAHVDAIMILGEAFQEDTPFHFGDQDTTYRIQHLVPVMLSHRMCAPPEESYSLHRKMSGVFLLCAKLNGTVNCYAMFHDIYRHYKFGGTWEDLHSGRL